MIVRFLSSLILSMALMGCAMRSSYVPRQAQSPPQSTAPSQLSPEEVAAEFRKLAAAVNPEDAPSVVTESVTQEGRSGGTPTTLSVVRISFPDRVFFDFAVDKPKPEAGPVFDMMAANLRRSTGGTVLTVIGHTDGVGSDAYNTDLSRRRALSVMQALVSRGANSQALSIVAVGKQQPVASNDTEEGRAKNRRVEFLVSPTLAANLTAVQHTTSQQNAQVDVYSVRPTGYGVDTARLGSLALLSPAAVRITEPIPQSVTPANPDRLDPTLRTPRRVMPAVPQVAKPSTSLIPPNERATPAPNYEPTTLEPAVQVRPPGPEISY